MYGLNGLIDSLPFQKVDQLFEIVWIGEALVLTPDQVKVSVGCLFPGLPLGEKAEDSCRKWPIPLVDELRLDRHFAVKLLFQPMLVGEVLHQFHPLRDEVLDELLAGCFQPFSIAHRNRGGQSALDTEIAGRGMGWNRATTRFFKVAEEFLYGIDLAKEGKVEVMLVAEIDQVKGDFFVGMPVLQDKRPLFEVGMVAVGLELRSEELKKMPDDLRSA